MTNEEIAERVLALRAITRATGMITKRSQNELLALLKDADLVEVAVMIRQKENERHEHNNR